jgi:hypothetical protein
LKSKEFDGALASWVRSQRQKKLRVSRQMIQQEALRTAKLYFNDEDEEAREFKVNSNTCRSDYLINLDK